MRLAKQSLIQRDWVFLGSQKRCSDFVCTSKVSAVVSLLNTKNTLSVIRFNQERVTGQITGDTCSAMSLEFLSDYLRIRANYTPEKDYRAYMLDSITSLASKFYVSSEEMRNRQAAYNTIEICSLDTPIDFSRAKVQSLLNYHSLEIDCASSEIDISKIDERDFCQYVEDLPEGAFLIRILKPAQNEKLEEYGHTIIYIKDPKLTPCATLKKRHTLVNLF